MRLSLLFAPLAGLWLLAACGERPPVPPEQTYPWQITLPAPGESRVFGITLGRSTLGEAVEALGRGYKLALFEDGEGRLSLEVFYSEVTRGGLSGKLVLVLDGTAADLAALRERATGAERLESGSVRHTLAEADRLAAFSRTVVGLDYIPYVNLDADIVTARFGAPAEKIATGPGREHWLYPEKGLDIVLDADGKELLQFVPPRDFARLADPLRRHAVAPPAGQ